MLRLRAEKGATTSQNCFAPRSQAGVRCAATSARRHDRRLSAQRRLAPVANHSATSEETGSASGARTAPRRPPAAARRSRAQCRLALRRSGCAARSVPVDDASAARKKKGAGLDALKVWLISHEPELSCRVSASTRCPPDAVTAASRARRRLRRSQLLHRSSGRAPAVRPPFARSALARAVAHRAEAPGRFSPLATLRRCGALGAGGRRFD